MTIGKILIAGCGALGSRIAIGLSVFPVELLLVDDDVVKLENVGTSAYTEEYIGMPKTTALATMMWLEHKAAAVAWHRTVDRLLVLADGGLIVDTFDNYESRILTRSPDTLHVGVNADRSGAVEWDENYSIPAGGTWIPRGENPVCTHELGKNILRYTAFAAVSEIREYLLAGVRRTVFVAEDGSLIT